MSRLFNAICTLRRSLYQRRVFGLSGECLAARRFDEIFAGCLDARHVSPQGARVFALAHRGANDIPGAKAEWPLGATRRTIQLATSLIHARARRWRCRTSF